METETQESTTEVFKEGLTVNPDVFTDTPPGKGKHYSCYMDWLHDQPGSAPAPPAPGMPSLQEVFSKLEEASKDCEAAVSENQGIAEKAKTINHEIDLALAAVHRAKDDKNSILSLLNDAENILDAPANQKKLQEINNLIETLQYNKQAKENELKKLLKLRIPDEAVESKKKTLILAEREFLRAVLSDVRSSLMASLEFRFVHAIYNKISNTTNMSQVFKDLLFDSPEPQSKKDAEDCIGEIVRFYKKRFTGEKK